MPQLHPALHSLQHRFLLAALACAAAIAIGNAPLPAGEGVAAAVASAPATHKQTAIIHAVAEGEAAKLEDFCLNADGNVLALVGLTRMGRAAAGCCWA
ncbi:MAG: hypothetical protein WD875_10735 [Pirellulales bacterium]